MPHPGLGTMCTAQRGPQDSGCPLHRVPGVERCRPGLWGQPGQEWEVALGSPEGRWPGLEQTLGERLG